MNVRASVLAGMARQLGRPDGVRGLVVGAMLNRANRSVIASAVQALAPHPGDTVADLGFGGAIGLDMLLRRVGTGGLVHGVELSSTMLAHAGRRFRHDIGTARLLLHAASMTRLPMPAGELDGVMTLNTIYFLAELGPAFAELARVTKPAGRVVLGLGDPELMGRRPIAEYGFRLRPVADVIQALHGAGLHLDGHRRVGTDPGAYHLLLTSRPGA